MTFVTEIRPIRTLIKGKHVLKYMIVLSKRNLQLKGVLRATHKVGKDLHKVFSTIVSEISQELTNFGESGSEVSHFIPKPRNFAEVKKLLENIRKPLLKATLKEIKNIINNQTFMIEDRKDGEPVTPCMDVYKAKSNQMEAWITQVKNCS